MLTACYSILFIIYSIALELSTVPSLGERQKHTCTHKETTQNTDNDLNICLCGNSINEVTKKLSCMEKEI